MNKRPLNGADAGADAAALRSAPGSSAVSGSLTVSAPGKVILFGEHAVVYGKRAVAASVGLRTTAVSRADASAVRLVLPDVCLDHSWPLERIRECIAGLVQGASGVEAAAAAAVSGATNAPTASAPESSRPDQAAAKPTKKRRGASGTTVPRRSSRASKPTTPGVDSAPALPHAPASLPAGLVDQLSSLLPDGCSGPAKQSVLAFFTLYALICRGRFGIEVQMESKLPVGAGLGSSASFSVCASATLLLHSGLVQLGDAGAGQTASFSNSQLEVINAWAFLSEKVIHGNPSGIDNSLCTYGTFFPRLSCAFAVVGLNFGRAHVTMAIQAEHARTQRRMGCASSRGKRLIVLDRRYALFRALTLCAL
nr:hypothetical protein HK105_005829 [Polyrhizophydium stewartii]